MIKVALCDDIHEYNKRMTRYIERYGLENHIETKVVSYISGKQLLLNYQRGKFDILFLDYFMPELDGIKTAELIRNIDQDVSIVFCTSYYTVPNASQGFKVEAEDFLAKPLLYKKIETILNKVYSKKLLKAEEKLFLRHNNGVLTLQLSDIIYIHTENKIAIVHTTDGMIESNLKIKEIEKRLSHKLFFRCHNSYLVNFDYVEGIQDNRILLTSNIVGTTEIPISKYKKADFLQELARYVLNKSE